jgi:hypothetical protein
VLARVSHEQNAVLQADSFEEVTHLFGAGKTRLVDHIQVTATVAACRLLGTAGQEALQSVGSDARFAELMRGARSRGAANASEGVRIAFLSRVTGESSRTGSVTSMKFSRAI